MRDAPTRAAIAGIYALTPELADTDALARSVGAALEGGVRIVQYRNKTGTSERRLDQATALRSLCASAGATFIVNDDVELAAAVAAHGVHLGRDDGTIAAARARLGPAALIGASCYGSLPLAGAAVMAGADYIAFGSFFPSVTKPDAMRANPSLIAAAKARWQVPVVAIGGITARNAAPLVAAGADALAVVTALFGAPDIAAAARELAAVFPTDARARPPR
jgi:thiamine-phosphate pyrophosphorylase